MDKLLKLLRKEKGLTQQQMTELLGLRYKSHYNQIENGKYKISLDLAYKISKIFDKSIEEIFFDDKVHD
ncbi:MAG: helix-turn-helix domain-containing protein [Caloramator sp.]|nr:helix-turn-helix domain-containing protein [Caloramator sp.]